MGKKSQATSKANGFLNGRTSSRASFDSEVKIRERAAFLKNGTIADLGIDPALAEKVAEAYVSSYLSVLQEE